MSAVPLLGQHKGCHCAERRPSVFRRLVAAVRRKPAVPADIRTAGAAPALVADGGSFWDDKAEARFACCVHCEVPTVCDPPDSHPAACSDGCNKPARSGVTAPSGFPVLRDRWVSEVRREYDEHLCALPEVHGKADPYYCTVPAHHCWAPLADIMHNGWRHHDGLTDAEIAALEPAAPAPWRPEPVFTPAITEQAAHAQAMHDLSARCLPAPPSHPYPPLGRRPPVYGEAPQLAVERDAARVAGLRARERYQPASPELLRQVLEGVRAL